MNPGPLGYEPYDARLCRPEQPLVTASTSIYLWRDVAVGPVRLRRLKLARRIRFTSPFTDAGMELRGRRLQEHRLVNSVGATGRQSSWWFKSMRKFTVLAGSYPGFQHVCVVRDYPAYPCDWNQAHMSTLAASNPGRWPPARQCGSKRQIGEAAAELASAIQRRR